MPVLIAVVECCWDILLKSIVELLGLGQPKRRDKGPRNKISLSHLGGTDMGLGCLNLPMQDLTSIGLVLAPPMRCFLPATLYYVHSMHS